MESILSEIIEALKTAGKLDDKDINRILQRHNRAYAQEQERKRAAGQAGDSTEARGGHRRYAKKHLMPFFQKVKNSNPELWRSWSLTPQQEDALIRAFRMKPRRTASGVATITVITKPWPCGSNCLYCPNDVRMPKSYLSDEPACQRAERNFFDPYLQVMSRLRALEQMGHATDKVELIVLGGTWSDYPEEYQIWFIAELFRALNEADTIANWDDEAEQLLRGRRTQYESWGIASERDDLRAFARDAQQRVDAGGITYNQAVAHLYDTPAWHAASAMQNATLEQLRTLHATNESARHRVVGLVVETRPDAVSPRTLTLLRQLGCTKVQMGIQSLDPSILAKNSRGTTLEGICRAFALLRLFGFKTHAHFMVNLLGATPEADKADYREFVTNPAYLPDEVKLYPCVLVESAALCKEHKLGLWQPYSEEDLIDVLVADTLATPAFTRVSRMIRDISAHDIVAGNKKTNLRQLVENRIEVEGASGDVNEIRYREIGIEGAQSSLEMRILEYETSVTTEFFLQWVTPENKIAGFLRLSLPCPDAFEQALGEYALELPISADEAMIREVHVYGKVAKLHSSGEHAEGAQHLGLGKRLVETACNIARERGFTRINVISAVGTREYYRSLGFRDGELYQRKSL